MHGVLGANISYQTTNQCPGGPGRAVACPGQSGSAPHSSTALQLAVEEKNPSHATPYPANPNNATKTMRTNFHMIERTERLF
jgi:hypothetical protein